MCAEDDPETGLDEIFLSSYADEENEDTRATMPIPLDWQGTMQPSGLITWQWYGYAHPQHTQVLEELYAHVHTNRCVRWWQQTRWFACGLQRHLRWRWQEWRR
jgi:hypothetical protein